MDRIRALARTHKVTLVYSAIGDHVSWNSEAGRVSGTVIAIHTGDFDYKDHVHHASEADPQYEIKSDKPIISQLIRKAPLNMPDKGEN